MVTYKKWGTRLEGKLHSLMETSSKETYQTLAKWLAFNRKRFNNEFSVVLCENFVGTKDSQRQMIYLQLLHEVLFDERICNNYSSTMDGKRKWDRLSDLRKSVGENVLLQVADQLCQTAKDKLVGVLLKEWDEANVFEVPKIISQIKRRATLQQFLPSAPMKQSVNDESSFTKEPNTDTSPVEVHSLGDMVVDDEDMPMVNTIECFMSNDEQSGSKYSATKALSNLDDVTNAKPNGEDSLALLMDSAKSLTSTNESGPFLPLPPFTLIKSKDNGDFDFDAMGIPEATVEPREFLDHCKSIATFQIARDLRNDGAVQLSSLLSAMPEDIRKLCAKNNIDRGVDDDPQKSSVLLSEAKARDFALRLNDILLDMDLSEQLLSVKLFHEIIQRQKLAREALIRLLIKSRCKFGSSETAAAFYDAEKIKNQLKKRSQILADAMELEGFDVEDSEEDGDGRNEDRNHNKKRKKSVNVDEMLAPFPWYQPSESEISEFDITNIDGNADDVKRED